MFTLKRVIYDEIEDFIKRFTTGVEMMIKKGIRSHERILRISRNAIIKNLEAYFTIYTLLMKRTAARECFEVLLNGNFTYQGITYALLRNERHNLYDEYEMSYIPLTLDRVQGKVERESIVIRHKTTCLISHELTKERKIKLNMPKKATPKNVQSRKILQFSGVESAIGGRRLTPPPESGFVELAV
jgi:hypothetical protein